jgi:hypothetical protein
MMAVVLKIRTIVVWIELYVVDKIYRCVSQTISVDAYWLIKATTYVMKIVHPKTHV